MSVLRLLLAIVALTVVAGCDVEDSGDSIKQGKQDKAASDGPAKAEPDGKFSSSCDLLLSSDIDGQNYFAGSAKMHNTGNVGIVVRVKMRFDMVASDNVTDEKTTRLAVGQRKAIKFRIPVTQEQISEHQGSPDYFNGKGCKVTPKIVDTFGAVKE